MIEAWFNERGYVTKGEKGEGCFIYALSPDLINDSLLLYDARWTVFNNLLDAIDEVEESPNNHELVLYTDSRLIEELNGDIDPQTNLGKESLMFFKSFDYFKFRSIRFVKCSPSTINDRLAGIAT